MNADPLLKKLQIPDGATGGVFHAPEPDLIRAPALEDWSLRDLEFVIVFVPDSKAIRERAPKAIATVKEDGVLWFVYPKKSGSISTDISRDHGWEPANQLGFSGVRQVAIDATWSALRFREERFIKRKVG